MDSISLPSTDLARRLLASEPARVKNWGTEPGAAPLPRAVRVCDKLRTVLTTFAGVAGFRSLLARALTLAAARVPELKNVTVLKDGSLSGFQNIESGKKNGSAREAAGWEQVLVAQLLDLLITFIGEILMLQLVSQAWPDLPVGQLSSVTENKS